jgi:hypothetical protein
MSDNFDFDGKQSRSRGGPMQIWDMLSILVLVITVCLVGYFLMVFINPESSLNIFRPGAGMFVPQPPTETPAPIQMEATWTASPTLEVTPSNTPRSTFTPFFTDTPFSLVPPTRTPKPTNTAKPTNTPKAPFTAISVTTVESTVIHPDLACNWAGIGGTVVDANNSPVIGMVVVLRGFLNGSTVDLTTVSGITPEYGQSGFEFFLGDAPIASNKTLYVQLLDLSNIPLSDKVEITTSADCSKNLVIVRFKKNR